MAEDGPAFAVQALKDGTCDALYIYSDTLKGELEKEAPASWAPALDGGIRAPVCVCVCVSTVCVCARDQQREREREPSPALLNPCIDKVVQTAEYRTICEKYFSPTSCIGGTDEILFYDATMDTRTDAYTCADGYCTCTE